MSGSAVSLAPSGAASDLPFLVVLLLFEDVCGPKRCMIRLRVFVWRIQSSSGTFVIYKLGENARGRREVERVTSLGRFRAGVPEARESRPAHLQDDWVGSF
jgi:hypothetical protein